tara:strand:+ start:2032 stop:3774 length:1743 start_codon:yes stop_codon:yes gene_type:complete
MSYGYVRQNRVGLDWGAIGKEMSTAIQEGEAERQLRKEDILRQEKEYGEQLLNQPQGEYAEANRFISEFSEQAQNQALSDLRALKNREISEREYYNRRANLQKGTDLMFLAATNFNKNYDKAMQDIRDGKSSVLLADIKAHMEGYTNFANSGTFINPATGTVNVSKLIDDGKGGKIVSSSRGDFMDASELVKMSNYNIANFDLDGEVNKVADSLGTLSITTPDNTKIQVSIADIASGNLDPAVAEAYNKELTASIKDYAESIVGTTTDPSAASILADHMVVGKDGYKVTFKEMSEKERNEKNLIFFDPNGALVLTEQQQKDAVEFVEKKLRSSLDRKIQPDVLTKYQKENIRLREEELKFRKGDLAFRRKAQKEARDKAGVDENTYIPIDSRKNFVVNENSTAESAYNNVDRTVTEDNINDNPEALKLSVKNIFDDNSAFSNISMNDVEVGVEEITLKEKSTKGIGTGAPGFQDEIEVKEKVMSFHIPELMEEPLIVPMTENAQLFKDVLKSLDLYNQEFIKGNVKDKMKLTDFKDLFGVDKPFETYNKVQVDATKNVTTDPPLPTFPNTGTGSSTLNFG